MSATLGHRIGYYRRALARRIGPEPRAVVLDALPRGSVGAEIGVWKGDFSALLLSHCAPRRLYLVDPWSFDPSFGDSLFGGEAARSQADMDAICDSVKARFSAEIASGVVQVRRDDSAGLAAEIPDGSLDWVYIDGNHDFEFVLADLRRLAPKVRPGGLVCGDDYGTTGTWWGDGVTRAVMTFVREADVVVRAVHNHQFVLVRASGT